MYSFYWFDLIKDQLGYVPIANELTVNVSKWADEANSSDDTNQHGTNLSKSIGKDITLELKS
jgi:ribonucleotide reductase beta subunit family protein with ferritin-like domain